jgi:hypothetical protein
MTNLLAVDAQNVIQFCGFAAWLWLEGMQLLATLAALYYLLGLGECSDTSARPSCERVLPHFLAVGNDHQRVARLR